MALRAHQHPQTPKASGGGKGWLIGEIIAHENGEGAPERRRLHELAQGVALVGARPAQLDDLMAWLQAESGFGGQTFGHGQGGASGVWGEAVMQGCAQSLGFHKQSGPGCGQGVEGGGHLGQGGVWDGRPVICARRPAIQAVNSRYGENGTFQDAVDLLQASTGQDRDPTVHPSNQGPEEG